VVFASYLIRLKVNPEKADNYFLGQLLSSYAAPVPNQALCNTWCTTGKHQRYKSTACINCDSDGEKGLDEQRRIALILEKQDAYLYTLKTKKSA